MKNSEIRKRFLNFFEKREHAIIPSASLVPENDPSVLFTTAGMQPLVPYLLGEKHPKGTRLANFQKVVRTVDIDEVGDNTHLTFFEMMGNWSLGDYFKKEAITWSYELLTSKEEGFGLDPSRLYVTCFEGDENAPKDTESAEIWQSLGIPEERIYFMDASNNWWSPGDNGPCGPDTEMFYDVKGNLNLTSKEDFIAADDKQEVVEIWNDVFMEYRKKDGKIVGKLESKNVDTGSGFERIAAVLQGKETVFDTDIFQPIIDKIKKLSSNYDDVSGKIIADHLRAAVFMISDGVIPSNTDQGYVIRRLLRRAIKNAKSIEIQDSDMGEILEIIITTNLESYPDLNKNKEHIVAVFTKEAQSFNKTLEKGLKQLEKIVEKDDVLDGETAFTLFSTYGFPKELIKEAAEERNLSFNEDSFDEAMKTHQEASKTASEGKFKGGLAGAGEQEQKYHTATHLLHAALREVLGDHVEQKGSNITAERLRFDFSHSEKMTDEQKEQVTKWVNEKIQKKLPMVREEMSLVEAKSKGAIGLFADKYGDVVSVYSMVTKDGVVISRELCGGPHVENTSALGTFRIKKEEASSAGIRRIKAVLE
jgi:alanyl-tRNA synthetase